MNFEVLKAYGIDPEAGVARCLNDAEFYGNVLAMFLDDDTLVMAGPALESKDYDALFRCMHTLKGACGSAAMKDLYAAVSSLTELLRHGGGADAEITDLYARVEAEYARAREGITLARKQ